MIQGGAASKPKTIGTWPGGTTIRYTTDGAVPDAQHGSVYACIYGESPVGKVTFANSGLTPEVAAIFQRIAWETVTAEPLTGVRR